MSQEIKTETSDTTGYNLETGTLIGGRFEINYKLATGGMGEVYVATQQPIGRKIALKVLKRELSGDEDSAKRFFREAVAASRLHHPNTITVIDYGEGEGGLLFIAMELLDGEGLHHLLKKMPCLEPARVGHIANQIGRSLAEAHSKGVIHRDLKPENIFISQVDTQRDLVKVLDFGIARIQSGQGATRITRAGYVCGTPEYMSPEQARGEELDGRSDIYSLSVMMWEMLEGRAPFHATTPLGIVLKHQTEPIPPITALAPESLKNLVYQGMAKDAVHRPANIEAFLADLDACFPEGMRVRSSSSVKRVHAPSLDPRDTPSPHFNTQNMALSETLASEELELPLPLGTTPTPAPVPAQGGSGFVKIALVAGGLLVMGASVFLAVSLWQDKGEKPKSVVVDTSILVKTSPPGARIYMNGRFMGESPATLSGAPGKTAHLKASLEGYVDKEGREVFPEAGSTDHAFALEKEPTNIVTVEVITTPPRAMLVHKDLVLGATPVELTFDKGDDPYPVEARLAGFETETFMIDPSAGTHRVQYNLREAQKVEEVPEEAEPAVVKESKKGKKGKKGAWGRKRPKKGIAKESKATQTEVKAPLAEKTAPKAPPVEKPPKKTNKYETVD